MCFSGLLESFERFVSLQETGSMTGKGYRITDADVTLYQAKSLLNCKIHLPVPHQSKYFKFIICCREKMF